MNVAMPEKRGMTLPETGLKETSSFAMVFLVVFLADRDMSFCKGPVPAYSLMISF
jgi:hypothetical protein